MNPFKRLFSGGSAANEQLTAIVGAALIVGLAIEGATLLRIGSLLTVHVFVGMLVIPVIALKLASTGWRMVRYYRHGVEYIERGPPHVALRVIVAPVVVLSTLVLFGTGVALLALGKTAGTILTLHKASFTVWLGSTAIHVAAHAPKLPRQIWQRVPGTGMRLAVVASALVAGAGVATATLPAADRLQDRVTAQIGFDAS
jgi:hypothetical protein